METLNIHFLLFLLDSSKLTLSEGLHSFLKGYLHDKKQYEYLPKDVQNKIIISSEFTFFNTLCHAYS